MVTMAPDLPAAIIRRAASCEPKKTASRLVDIMSRQLFAEVSRGLSHLAIPALATNKSTVPKARSAASKALFIAEGSVTSATATHAAPPASSILVLSA